MDASKMPKVYNTFFTRPVTPCPAGNKTRQVKALRLNDYYLKEPYVVREYDIREYINSFASDTDMRVIISRYLSGDPNIKVNTQYADVHNVPDLRAALDINAKVRGIYNTLGDDIKRDLTFDGFMQLFGTDAGIKALINANTQKVEENKNNES